MGKLLPENIFSVDRHEGEYLICISDDGKVFELSDDIGLKDGDIFTAEVSDGDCKKLYNITPVPEETIRRKNKAREKLDRLFGRKPENKSTND